jgi:hypothetical protein
MRGWWLIPKSIHHFERSQIVQYWEHWMERAPSNPLKIRLAVSVKNGPRDKLAVPHTNEKPLSERPGDPGGQLHAHGRRAV